MRGLTCLLLLLVMAVSENMVGAMAQVSVLTFNIWYGAVAG